MLVDDAHWADQPSADALAFVARRLDAEGVVMLIAVREGEGRAFPSAGLPVAGVGRLDRSEAVELLRHRFGSELSTGVGDRLVESSGGNPLALLEMPAALTGRQRDGRDPLPQPVPLGQGLEQALLGSSRRLSEPAQMLLLVTAAEGSGDAGVIVAAAKLLGAGQPAVQEALGSGLVQATGDRIGFRHPLIRSAVYHDAGYLRRQSAHRALVQALGGEVNADRRAWHRAAMVTPPDDEVADELERTADRARLRSGHGAAASALERSASFTSGMQERGRRFAAAAAAAWQAGQPDRSLELISASRGSAPAPRVLAQLDHLRGVIEAQRGSPRYGYQILLSGAARIAEDDPDKALEMLADALEASEGRDLALAEVGRRADALTGLANPELQMVHRYVVGIGALFGGDKEAGVPLLRQYAAWAPSTGRSPWLLHAARGTLIMGDPLAAERLALAAVDAARSAGSLPDLLPALWFLAATKTLASRYRDAREHASELVDLAAELGFVNWAVLGRAVLARIAAVQGQEAECRGLVADVHATVGDRGWNFALALAGTSAALLELGCGRPADALAAASAVAASGGTEVFWTRWGARDHVEAAVRSGQPGRASWSLAALRRHASPAEPLLQSMLGQCLGLLAGGDQARQHLEDAVACLGTGGPPFERARAALLLGEVLRRGRLRAEARAHLRFALETFEDVGASPWAARARAELQATGERARRRDPSMVDQLTPQELRIARFICEGASNKEIAAKLFVSPRTVDAHLRKVFVKLGISSRAELARTVIGRTGAEPT